MYWKNYSTGNEETHNLILLQYDVNNVININYYESIVLIEPIRNIELMKKTVI